MDTDDVERSDWSGLLAFNKPQGVTSRDCVNQIVRLLRQHFPKPKLMPKVGHAGTLDPLATGVLVMGIGAGVRLVPYIQQMSKVYDATFQLGRWSETGDVDGEVFLCDDAPVPSRESWQAAANALTGNITQVPPSTSAIRVGGTKAYKLAHRGIAVEMPSREVRVDSFAIGRYEYPEFDALIECGSGTYVRTLGMDLAIQCSTRAVMSRLVRTRIGAFELANCVSPAEVTAESLQSLLLPLAIGVTQLPRLELSASQLERLCHGTQLRTTEIDAASVELPTELPTHLPLEAKVLDGEGHLRAIVQRRNDVWCPYRVFHR